ncbi:MAG TPA: hypothetical protein VMC05_12510, partial [Xanthobacteraceae bacterium]|nr:hypothetical protein [Xanthobacteraceae bacterium]
RAVGRAIAVLGVRNLNFRSACDGSKRLRSCRYVMGKRAPRLSAMSGARLKTMLAAERGADRQTATSCFGKDRPH